MKCYALWASVALCQFLYPVRGAFPGLYAAAAEVHLDALAAWLGQN